MRIATADLSVSADGGRPEAASVDHRFSSDTYGLDNAGASASAVQGEVAAHLLHAVRRTNARPQLPVTD